MSDKTAPLEEKTWEQLVREDDICPVCFGDLDTGYECLQCGRDWIGWRGESDKDKKH